MANTANLNVPIMEASQAQKHVTFNDAMRIVDALVMPSVKGVLTAPPGSPVDGDRWRVGVGATGSWAGKDNNLTIYMSGVWYFLPQKQGWTVYDNSNGNWYIYGTTSWGLWGTGGVLSPNGASGSLQVAEELVTLTSGTTKDMVFQIPDRAIVFGVGSRTNVAITGAPNYSVGTPSSSGQFGSSLGVTVGSRNMGVIGPTAFYAATPVRITSGGAAFTAGAVRLSVFYMPFVAPTS